MPDKYKTCQHCPDRFVGCRATCKGWAHREAEKQKRYHNHALRISSEPRYPRVERLMRANVLENKQGRHA